MSNTYGEFVREIRRRRGMLLQEMASRMKVTSAIVSSVETGRKPFPQEWRAKVIEILQLDEKQVAELDQAIDRSRRKISIDLVKADPLGRDVAVAFARSFESLSPQVLAQIQGLIKKEGSRS